MTRTSALSKHISYISMIHQPALLLQATSHGEASFCYVHMSLQLNRPSLTTQTIRSTWKFIYLLQMTIKILPFVFLP